MTQTDSKHELRIVFAGTPDFAATTLQQLLAEHWPIVAVYTQPDRPAGRGQKVRRGPVSQLAHDHQIPVEQPLNFREENALDRLVAFKPDIMVVVAYGLILPRAVLDLPRLGCLNIHASLLPRWRGAAPIQRAIEAGDENSGVCIMQMEEGLDTGPVLMQETLAIKPDETGGSLHDRLAVLGGRLIHETLSAIESGQVITPKTQSDIGITYAHKLRKEEAQIDWNRSAVEIERMVRAFNPWPVAVTSVEGSALKIWEAERSALDSKPDIRPGTVVASDTRGIHVACGQDMLILKQVQLAGGRRLPIRDFCNGKPQFFQVGQVLGDGPEGDRHP